MLKVCFSFFDSVFLFIVLLVIGCVFLCLEDCLCYVGWRWFSVG